MNLKKFLMASGLSMVLVLGACGGDEDAGTDEPATEEDSGASSGDVDAEGIAQSTCASCHGEDFSGAVGPALAGTSLSEDEFEETVRNGSGQMPAYSEDQINNEELSALYTFFSEQ
ncbi:cytochrome c [Jeotgalicoccus nanhaiensis]|uniref:Cytochrome c n=1 Tax=Jeotgalicoccus nanhaiensis TaxID=568603 RepID=A0ABR9XZ29_9STAP|nr:cytochrome c [Jeotgalicoccus nanhaiensis]MBF0753684.1 cytochrome c [Jeotgalicoccus nanhaiensis]TFU61849.1 cytochrome c [Jeotgalicoccus nanhaiensis]